MALNKVIIMGRLTAAPDFKQTQSGVSCCRFTVAVDSNYKAQDGEKQTDFINVTAWRSTADFVSRYFDKGSMIIVEGKIKNNNYEDSNGVKHYSYVVTADSVYFGESKRTAQNDSECVQTGVSNQGTMSQASGQTAQSAALFAPEAVSSGTLADFEEILSDGELPF